MPRSAAHTLSWSSTDNGYALSTQGQFVRFFEPGLEAQADWFAWLGAQKSCSFQGRAGHLNLLKESRPRGGGYWYAYYYTGQRILKRYLGTPDQITFARLEELVQELSREKTTTTPDASQPTSPTVQEVQTMPTTNSLGQLDQRQTLLVTKLSPPILPGSLLPRERLLAELKVAFSKPLTLVAAAAGWGKTTLLSSWVADQNVPVAWLALDQLDNDLTLFWVSVISALQRLVPTLGETALALLRSTQPASLSAILTALLNELAALEDHTRPIILVVDDYQFIEDPAIHESVVFWIEHFPPNMHLVIASRLDPPFPLARWRVKGRLAEIRAGELGFTHPEASLFLKQSGGHSLTEDEISTLATRTQGWAAGLQLANLSLEKQADKTSWIANFTGSNRYLLDYVEEEILRSQPLAIQDFLLKTAVLTRMNAALCEAVTDEAASHEVLHTLERANLFIIALDDQRQWYRLHDLFREVLLARLHLTSPDLVPRLHLRAAHWYAEHHEAREAIAHALAAPDFSLVASILEREADHLWLTGQTQAVFNWVQLLPDQVLIQHARLALEAARRLIESLVPATKSAYTKGNAQVEQLILRLERVMFQPDLEMKSAAAQAEEALIKRRIGLLQALLATRMRLISGDAGGLKQLLEEVRGLAEDEDLNWRMVAVSLSFWLAESVERRGAVMISRLLEVKQQAIQAGNTVVLAHIKNRLAFAYIRAGHLRLAEQECLEGLALMHETGELSANEAYLHYFLENTYYMWNRLEEANREVQEVLRLAQLWQNIDLLVVGYVAATEIELGWGNLAGADQALQKAEELVQREQFVTHIFWVTGSRAQYWLASGELNRAREWAENLEFSLQTWNHNQFWAFLARIQVFIALHHYRQAVEILETFQAHLDRPTEDVATTIEFLAVYFVALHRAGKSAQSRIIGVRLLAMTQPIGFVQVYLHAGEPMRQALENLLAAAPEQNPELESAQGFSRSYVLQLIKLLEQEQPKRKSQSHPISNFSSAESSPSHASTVEKAEVGSGEQLSPQEQRVLRLLVSGQTYAEMAEELVVSLNTIKTQVSSIYRKLGVSRRSEAVTLVQRGLVR